MNREPLAKLHASQSIEDLLDTAIADDNSWLLSYLDVFVLIVMLVIILLAVSDVRQKSEVTSQPFSEQDRKPVKKPPPKKLPAQATINTLDQTDTTTSELQVAAKPELTVAQKTEQAVDTQVSEAEAATAQDTLQQQPNSAETETGTETETETETEIIVAKQDQEINTDNVTTESKQLENSQAYWQELIKQKLEGLELNDSVNINVSQGYAQIAIQDNILFASAKAELMNEGKILLQRLIPLLNQSSGLIFIEGHTDNHPIETAKFPSNWELGSARATSVLHFLVLQKVENSRLRAVTYADTMPIADNNTKDGRSKNRRVNLLIKLPEQLGN